MSSLLNEIQQKLKVPKGQYNAFAKYHYRNAEDILEAVKPLLGDRGTLIVTDEVVQIGERYYVKATAILKWRQGTESAWLDMEATATGWAREELDKKGMDAAQITGAASSYARKYALNGLFCIDDTKDADTQDNSGKPATAPKQAQGATKPAQTVKATDTRQEAAKDRIRAALAHLGEKNDTQAEVAAAIKKHTGLELQIANFDLIGEKLWAIVEAQVDPIK